jgi:hypothetical protein
VIEGRCIAATSAATRLVDGHSELPVCVTSVRRRAVSIIVIASATTAELGSSA